MPSNGKIRGVSLYSFYSVLLPGIAFLLALVPLIPDGLRPSPLVALLPLITLGFIAGQGLHSIAVVVQSIGRYPTHREVFDEYVNDAVERANKDDTNDTNHDDKKSVWKSKDTNNLDEDNKTYASRVKNVYKHIIIIEFRKIWRFIIGGPVPIENRPIEQLVDRFETVISDNGNVSEFDFISSNDINDKDENNSRQKLSQSELDSLYVYTRSKLQLDTAGRGRSMQAIYAFCRSIWITSFVLALVYFVYGMFRYPFLDNFLNGDIFAFVTGKLEGPMGGDPSAANATQLTHTGLNIDITRPAIELLAIPSELYLFFVISPPLLTYLLFQSATHQYKRYYIQYLMADIINSTSENDDDRGS